MIAEINWYNNVKKQTNRRKPQLMWTHWSDRPLMDQKKMSCALWEM